MDKELLQQMIIEKFVMVQKHPDADLFIYNYTNKAQYEKVWNEVTLQSRGLILDGNLNFVARPFKKFFNLEEYPAQQIPDQPFDVYEKLDGSLGILYWINNVPYIATRGSFISDQALHATKILHNNYSYIFNKLDRDITYLFEIIYPGNRIVVDYGLKDDLILLAAIDTLTGDDLPLPDLDFAIVKKYDGIEDLNKLKALEEDTRKALLLNLKAGFA